MKKKIHIILIMLVLLTLVLQAQRFNGGILLGLNASQIDGDMLSGYNKAGPVGGVYVHTQLNRNWQAQMEIKYCPKGSATPKDAAQLRKARLLYIEIPVLLSYEIIRDLKIQGGVGFGYLFSAMQTEGSGYYDFRNPPESFELSGQIGIWYDFLDNFGFMVRYSYSVFPVKEGLISTVVGAGTWYNNVFGIGVAYRFGR